MPAGPRKRGMPGKFRTAQGAAPKDEDRISTCEPADAPSAYFAATRRAAAANAAAPVLA